MPKAFRHRIVDWMLAVHARNREAAAGYKVDTDRQSPRLRIEVGAGHEPRRADSQRRLEQLFGHQEQPRGLRRKHPSVPTQISTEAQKIACGPACHRLLRFAEATFLRRQQLRSCLIQVGQGEQHMELCRIFPQSAVARHGMTPLALDHPERKLDDRPPARRSLYFRALAGRSTLCRGWFDARYAA